MTMTSGHTAEQTATEPVTRFEVQRQVAASPATVFTLLCDPQGHVRIDSSGMLQSAEGEPMRKVGDDCRAHGPGSPQRPPRRSLRRDRDHHRVRAGHGHRVDDLRAGAGAHHASLRLPARALRRRDAAPYYDWSAIPERYRAAGAFLVIPEAALRATLGILARNVE
jgi:hypothetical protein